VRSRDPHSASANPSAFRRSFRRHRCPSKLETPLPPLIFASASLRPSSNPRDRDCSQKALARKNPTRETNLPNLSVAMALSDRSRESLLPSFLYASSARSFAATGAAARLPVSSPAPATAGAGGGVPFSIQAPKEKIEMYSPAFYAACTAGGIASCGLTHMAVTPLDLVKCNMQVSG
jgi:hypothetical protein